MANGDDNVGGDDNNVNNDGTISPIMMTIIMVVLPSL